jgi:hypothetical protein
MMRRQRANTKSDESAERKRVRTGDICTTTGQGYGATSESDSWEPFSHEGLFEQDKDDATQGKEELENMILPDNVESEEDDDKERDED